MRSVVLILLLTVTGCGADGPPERPGGDRPADPPPVTATNGTIKEEILQ